MDGWAARYSTDIADDLARGYSYAGWALSAAPSEREAWERWLEYCGRLDYETDARYERSLDRGIERCEDEGKWAAHLGDGFAVALPGLSAFYADDPETAIAYARNDERFAGMPLYVFPASWIEDDQDAAASGNHVAVVRPEGPAELAAASH